MERGGIDGVAGFGAVPFIPPPPFIRGGNDDVCGPRVG